MSGNVDLNKILQSYKKDVFEIEEKVGEWTFHIHNLPVTLKIKVMRVMPNNAFMGVANYQIQNPTQASPYMSLYLCNTVEDALKDALNGFLAWWDAKQVKKTKFFPVPNW